MKINRQCITRLGRYRNALHRLEALGFVNVFSDNIADAVGVTASCVRKDFSIFGISGNKKRGYAIAGLIAQINHILGKDEIQKAIVIGVGNIGQALMNYPGFVKEGINIIAGFDIDPSKYSQDSDIPILAMDNIGEYIKEHKIKLAIIATPDIAAQQVLDIAVSSGVRGVLNFAPIRLKTKRDCVVSNVNLVLELETVIYFVNTLEKKIKI